jgi:probable HAF family extracellular repeat protein
MQDLGVLSGGVRSEGYGISADGTTVVGYGNSASGDRAFRWTSAGGMQNLGVLGGTTSSYAHATSSDGSVVAGSSGTLAFRWTSGGGMQSLGTLAGETSDRADAVSPDGAVIGGLANSSFSSRAFVWDATNGIRNLNAVLTGLGVDLTGWQLDTLSSITGSEATGFNLAGSGFHNGTTEAYLVTGVRFAPVPEPATALAVAAGGLIVTRQFRRRRALPALPS